MYRIFLRIICILIIVTFTVSESTPSPTSSTTSLIDNVAQYVAGAVPYSPPTAYHYTEPNYGPQSYDNYLMPYLNPGAAPIQNGTEDEDDSNLATYQFLASVLPYARMMYRLLAKIGTLLLGGSLLFALGGLLTTAVCTYTPFCTIQFNGFNGISRETMRSLVTPENLNTASTLVHKAIEKYQQINKRK